MFYTITRFFIFACIIGAAGAALKRRVRFSAPTNKKIGSGSGTALKVVALAPRQWYIYTYIVYNNIYFLGMMAKDLTPISMGVNLASPHETASRLLTRRDSSHSY